MTVFVHELRRGRLSLAIWSVAIAFMLAVCIFIYPEMSSQMGELSEMFADMGSFSQAFGMDELNFGEFMGYFGIECGNTLGIGGALFAALLGISALSKEEQGGTADLLLTHPISRARIVSEKLLSVVVRIAILDLTVILATVLSCLLINAECSVGKLALLFLAHFLLQLEIAAVTFAISAFLRGNGIFIGIGLSLLLYFLNLLSNLLEELRFLRYLTPFSYTDSGYIFKESALEVKYLIVGIILMILAVILAYRRYTTKDIK
ncbi:MAG: ABC transporter permease subunit [Clostridia bacterium]|nr:ABC transporter permease subunit [Clostridia bacterium]